ncbi:TPA: MucBP domain-containing protein, partial [Listeria monocytogenes]
TSITVFGEVSSQNSRIKQSSVNSEEKKSSNSANKNVEEIIESTQEKNISSETTDNNASTIKASDIGSKEESIDSWMPDKELQELISQSLNIPVEQLTQDDLAHLTGRLEVSGISDLTGVEYAQKIDGLSVQFSEIASLSPIFRLNNLNFLDISYTQLNSLSGIESLINLKTLNLNSDSLSDISALSELTNLQDLFLYDNSISDISPLYGLTEHLVNLGLNNNNIHDLSGINSFLKNSKALQFIALSGNKISDVSIIDINAILDNDLTLDISSQIVTLPKHTFDDASLQENPLKTIVGYDISLDNLIGTNSEVGSYDPLNNKITWNNLSMSEGTLTGTWRSNVSSSTKHVNIIFDGSFTQAYVVLLDATPVTVKYINEAGKELAVSDILNGKIGLPYQSTAKTIKGWALKETPKNAVGTFTNIAQTVTYVYERIEAAPVTVRYQDEEGNELAPSTVLNGKVGLPYQTTAKSIDGWVLEETPANASGTFTKEVQEVVYVYERTEAAPVTVKYQDEEGNELVPSTTLNGKVGLPYQSEAVSIDGWTLKEIPANISGVFTEKEQVVTFEYKKINSNQTIVPPTNIDKENSISSSKSVSDKSNSSLPQTGEQQYSKIWGIIGILLLGSSALVIGRRKTYQK